MGPDRIRCRSILALSSCNFSSYSKENNLYVYIYIYNASSVAATLSMQWGDRQSGGDSASDQESGGKGRQLATSGAIFFKCWQRLTVEIALYTIRDHQEPNYLKIKDFRRFVI